jgi:hypothetical protein
MKMKKVYFTLSAVLVIVGSTAFGAETILKRCQGYTPSYFVELIKVEQQDLVVYQVNLQGKLTKFRSAVEAEAKFNQDCLMVKSWE